MVIEKLRRDYFYSLVIFIFIEFILILSFLFVIILFEELLGEGLIILMIGSVGFWFLTVVRIKGRYRQLTKDQLFRVITLDKRLNYPTSFKKSFRVPLFTFERGYIMNKQTIPKAFVGFIEGNLAYPIKELDNYQSNAHYKILHIHQGYAALISDNKNKKFLIHIDNLEIVE